ncbi:MAG: hypothetical protein E6Q43_03490 [Dokdonella sp.]|nr:MAG: hypothetical protein E6Q43_03490 [Dokdonella sp.]
MGLLSPLGLASPPTAEAGQRKARIHIESPQRMGMTWGVGAEVSRHNNIANVSCHGSPKIDGKSCDAYVGDTQCSLERPVLCIRVDGRERPAPSLFKDGVVPDEFYAGWAAGRVALAPAVRGDRFATSADVDAYCADTFGSGWRVAEHHDGNSGKGGWGFTANGHISGDSRFWVSINDQNANCWEVGHGSQLEYVSDSVVGTRPALWTALNKARQRVRMPAIDLYAENPSLTEVLFRADNRTWLFFANTRELKQVMHAKMVSGVNAITDEPDSSGGVGGSYVLWQDGVEQLRIGGH